MKNQFIQLCLFSILSSASIHASPTWQIISDYDDTVKIANFSGSNLDKIQKALLEGDFYAGMAKLYEFWTMDATHHPAPLHFLSASPTFIEERVEEFLEENNFFNFKLTLRDWFTQRDTAVFKYQVLKSEYLKASSDLILVGDDAQFDHQVYERFSRDRKILAIYIRNIRLQTLPVGQRAFTSAFDIAAFETLDGRLTESQALKVAEVVLSEKDEKVLPSFIPCTNLKTSCMSLSLSGQLKIACDQIEKRIQSICSRR
jgi:phosphatidate phosphatase APP1